MPEAPAPYDAYTTGVRDEWLDYNGHLNDSSYGVVLSEANEEFLAELGLSADYRAATGAALYTVESHIRYLAECSRGHTLRASTVLVAADTKRLRVYTEIVRDDDRLAATGEFLYLHVDAAKGTTTAMPGDRVARVEDVLSAHTGIPRPAHLGAGIGWERPRDAAAPARQAI